ncbi:MAG: translation elongation factor Ts [Anaerohalosphaera sp.]|nr:translation elongation factor Ts [Anaerohalosphaera sp.]
MADISAATVMKLRKMSGQGMMDCKNALAETDGDLDKAMEILKKKGMATMAKRAARDTTQGKIVTMASDDKKTVAMASLCCETDFVAKSDDFLALAEVMAPLTLTCEGTEGADAINNAKVDGKLFSEMITDLVGRTGEKTEAGDFTRYEVQGCGIIGTYIHFNGTVGAMVEVETSSDEASAAVGSVAADVCMHITAINPVGLNRDTIPADVIEKERAEATASVQNKPAEIIEKIVDGKMGRFFKENCLVDQPFVKDDTVTVGQTLENAAKQAGGTAKIKRFVRFEIG